MAERCGNTIHSDYVTDHRCVKEREHLGDCWFGFGIPHLKYVGVSGAIPIPEGFQQLALYVIVPPPYATVVSNQDDAPASMLKGDDSSPQLMEETHGDS